MEIDEQSQRRPKRERSDDTEPTLKTLCFDSSAYKEGRGKVAAITATSETSSSHWTYAPWKKARVLLWADHDEELHVTVAKSEERSLHFRVATHRFEECGDYAVSVFADGPLVQVEVCSFAGSAALRDLFLQRLRDGPRDGDDSCLTPMMWPCVADLRKMLSRPMPRLPPGMLVELTRAVAPQLADGLSTASAGEETLWGSLRAALGA